MKAMVRNRIVAHFLASLEHLYYGSLHLTTPQGRELHFQGDQDGPEAVFIVHHWDVIVNAAKRGDIGLGEDYIDGYWESPDIGALIELFLRNMPVFESFAHGNIIHRSAFRAINALRSNRKSQSRRNIKAHYDVGNAFYKLWLDDSMTYSSALYDNADALEEAQNRKYERILERATGGGGSREILEIGCGWGGFAHQAAARDHDVTALTISQAQYDFARERLQRAGLLERVKLKLQDYRETSGSFDSIVSIEMFEAVGEQYWPSYFRTLSQRLREGGQAVIQTITVDDAIFPDYRKRSDFIRQYTFPGGMLPSVSRFQEEAGKAGMKCREVYSFGRDYARTLGDWLERFDARIPEIKAMGYSDAFIRSWRFYLGMCIGAFNADRTNVIQAELVHA